MDKDTPELRAVAAADLPIFFEQQLDAEANAMAAFTAADPTDRSAFDSHWAKILADSTLIKRTIVSDGRVAGYIASHRWFGEPEVSYWLGREFWGRGVATAALAAFLRDAEATRPLFGHVAQDNLASLRVLQKCGFMVVGEDKGFANARGREVAEFILRLD